MKTCRKCGHRNTSVEVQEACPACGAIYAKVEAAIAAKARTKFNLQQTFNEPTATAPKNGNRTMALVALLIVCVIGAGGYFGHERYKLYEQRQAELSHCSETALAAWQDRMKPALEQFDRTAKAAGVAPRITLAPLILKLAEARAEAKKIPPPPPCATEAVGLLHQAMERKEDAWIKFARNDGDSAVTRAMYEAERTLESAFTKLAEARAKAVK